MAKISQQPARWSASGLGRQLLAEEQPILDELVRRFHGDSLVWSGVTPAAAAGVKRCMVRNRFYLASAQAVASTELASLRGDLDALPLPTRSVDGFVLHHSLELEEDPRQALREVGRVIRPGGRLLICAFNGMSLWGLRAFYGRLRPDIFSNLRFINPPRLLDWLALLGFAMEDRATYLGFGLPLSLEWRQPAPLGSWLHRVRPPTGGVLIVSALKQVRGARWVGRQGVRRRSKVSLAAHPKPTARRPLGQHR